uniref:TBC1 domain family member 23 n=1 Tax=Spongospora subterranea TaxID=70186 RepID=A0A0H5RA84_9EUKA|eukprot:CRZ11060.1 hypothetical protein [Spongospora subterranea]
MSTDDRSKFRKAFTHHEVENRIALRKNIPAYRQLLMESAIEKTSEGFVFDIQHPSWLQLVSLVNAAPASEVTLKRQSKSKDNRYSISRQPIRSVSELPNNSVEPHTSGSLGIGVGFSLQEELTKPSPDSFLIRKHCSIDVFTDSNRAQLWAVLLNGNVQSPREDINIALKDYTFDLYNQRVIRMDIQRTRPDVDYFRDNDDVREALEIILTVFCKRHLINYKQGINYIAAPFIYVFGAGQIKEAYWNFSNFIGRFCPNTFTDDQFGGLQCIFRVFRALLVYHDPKLANFLDEHGMSPELYASPWFMTFFANRVAFPPLIRIWDHLILHGESLIIYFLAVALLISNSEMLRNQSPVVLPERLTQLNIESIGLVDQLFALANALLANTPVSFLNFFRCVVSKNITVDSSLYESIASLECVCIDAQEVVEHCYPTAFPARALSPSRSLKFFIIDCRPSNHYNSGRLPVAYHLNPVLYMEPEKLARTVQVFSSNTDSHFVFLLDSHDARARKHFMGLQLFFIQNGFKYVSSCLGGFSACHDFVIKSGRGIDLVDHKRSTCIDCIKSLSGAGSDDDLKNQSKRGFLSIVRNRLAGSAINAKDGSDLPHLLSDLSVAGDTSSLNNVKTRFVVNDDFNPSNFPTCGADIFPDKATILPRTVDVRLLFCNLRESSVTNAQYTACAQRLTFLLISKTLDMFPVRDSSLSSKNGFPFTGCRLDRAIVAAALHPAGLHCLEQALNPFMVSGRFSTGVIHSKQQFTNDDNGVLRTTNVFDCCSIPDGTRSGVCNVIVFLPLIDSEVIVNNLLKSLHDRGFNSSVITLVSFIAIRPILWQLAADHTDLTFIIGAIDQSTDDKADPGANDFQSMYIVPDFSIPYTISNGA